MKYEFTPKGVCTQRITFYVDDDGVIGDVTFIGGCAGNTTGVSRLVKGRNVQDVIDLLADVECGFRGTSCPAQFALALKKAL